METLAGRLRRESADDGLVADQDDLVEGMAQRVIDGARDDLGGSVVPAHRIDGEAYSGRHRRRPAVRPGRSPGQRAASPPPAGLSSIARRPL